MLGAALTLIKLSITTDHHYHTYKELKYSQNDMKTSREAQPSQIKIVGQQ